eukprot:1160937-Pelagomonas_calceolata.AAC.4
MPVLPDVRYTYVLYANSHALLRHKEEFGFNSKIGQRHSRRHSSIAPVRDGPMYGLRQEADTARTCNGRRKVIDVDWTWEDHADPSLQSVRFKDPIQSYVLCLAWLSQRGLRAVTELQNEV